MGWYSKFLTRFPYIAILVVMAVSIIFGGVVFKYKGDDLLDFSSNSAGMEPRGTLRHGWSLVAKKLMEMINGDELAIAPFDNVARKKRHVEPYQEDTSLVSPFSSYRSRAKRQVSPPSGECLDEALHHYPGPHLVVEASKEGGNLLTPAALRATCRLEEEYVRIAFPDNKCPPHSLALYVADMANKSCGQIEQSDIDTFTNLIRECSSYYFNKNLTATGVGFCIEWSCPDVPAKCLKRNIVYKTLHFFADKDFGSSTFDKVTYGLLGLHFTGTGNQDEAFLNYYVNYLSGKDLNNGEVKITGIELYGIKFEVFDKIMGEDLPLFALAAGLILLILVLYLRSIVLVIATLINVMISFTATVFIYFYICQFKYFTSINLMSGLILIAIGADDIFVLHDYWTSTKQMYGPQVPIEKMVSHTLHHGALSIFVTSFTTAAAFAANIVSDITAIRLFGVFSGLCVVVNFLFMITWMIGLMVLVEKGDRLCCKSQCCSPPLKKLEKANGWIYQKLLPVAIIKPAIFWVILFILIGTGGLIMVFYKPRLNLPSSSTFQLFRSTHPLERYDLELKDHFRFTEDNSDRFNFIDIQLLWGVEGKDNGDWLNPNDTGTLKFVENFNIYEKTSLEWLAQVCKNLVNQDFVRDKNKYACILDEVSALAAGPCNDPNFPTFEWGSASCCDTVFPGDSSVNKRCMMSLLQNHRLPRYARSRNLNVLGDVLFDTRNKTKAFRYLFESTQKFTQKNDIMVKFYDTVSTFMTKELKSAPDGMKDGWFASFYGWSFFLLDLQEATASGTFNGISVSLAVGFLVLVITTPNIFLAGSAIVSIAFAIAITVGALAAQGWELNIIESIIITVSVGLSIDFTIHYCVAYRKSKEENRKLRVREALRNVGSAVSMAALTTFLAGAAIMPGRAIIYVKFGIFLMLVMASSWVFANFFFLGLCSLIGPQGKTGELLELFKKCCKKEKSKPSRESLQRAYMHYKLNTLYNWERPQKTERWLGDYHEDTTFRKRLTMIDVEGAPQRPYNLDGSRATPLKRPTYFPYSPYHNTTMAPMTWAPLEQRPYHSMLNYSAYRQHYMNSLYGTPRRTHELDTKMKPITSQSMDLT